MSKFGDRLKDLREKNQILSKNFANDMNVKPATVTNWEKGNRFPKEDMLIKIADYFNCSVDYLLGRTDDPNSIVYMGKYNNDIIEIDIDKKYPQKLTSDDIKNLIKDLESVGFDINTLINKSKNK